MAQPTVARRIVMPRQVWDELTHLAEVLGEARGLDVSPAEIALLALEAGLNEVRQGRPVRTAPARSRQAAKKEGSGRRRRPSQPLKLSADERSELEAFLVEQNSARGRQRTIGLWLGSRRRRIEVEWLRELAVEYDAYNVANFAQNMKKDSAFFKEVRDRDGSRIGWKLTAAGLTQAKELATQALEPA